MKKDSVEMLLLWVLIAVMSIVNIRQSMQIADLEDSMYMSNEQIVYIEEELERR